MCAPTIIDAVHKELSRRSFLTALGGALAVSVAAPEPAVAQQKPVRLDKGFREVVDLTHTFSARLPVFPAFKPVQIRPKFAIAKDGFFANEITFDEHTGTHMDAPAHFVANGPTADRLPAERFFAPLAVVSIAARAAANADAVMTVDDVLAWEKAHGRLPAGVFVAMHSGWDARIGDAARFLNKDAKGNACTRWIQRRGRAVSRAGTRHCRCGSRYPEPRHSRSAEVRRAPGAARRGQVRRGADGESRPAAAGRSDDHRRRAETRRRLRRSGSGVCGRLGR